MTANFSLNLDLRKTIGILSISDGLNVVLVPGKKGNSNLRRLQ